nr:unnamed protein product [Spirometra erinaceieuropaei]
MEGGTDPSWCSITLLRSRTVGDRRQLVMCQPRSVPDSPVIIRNPNFSNGFYTASQLTTAFVQKDLKLKASFESKFEKAYLSAIERIDFTSQEAYKIVNAWVNRTTDGLIKEIYKAPSDLSKDLLMMLLNSVYFKDEWRRHFISSSTNDETFRTSPSSRKTVKMMKESDYMQYYSDESLGYKLVMRPFSNDRFQFVVVLPTQDLQIEKLDRLFNEGFDWEVLKKTSEKAIELSLPRFKLEHELDLVPILRAMGVRNLFRKELADLSGITEEATLYVEKAKQNVALEVTEKGVKAAAVSSLGIIPMSAKPVGEPFVVDQPFFCVVFDRELMLPLFLARVVDPQPV